MAELQNVEHGVIVKLEYTLNIEDELVESTEDEGPIEFMQGYGEIIPGLEAALYGMEVTKLRQGLRVRIGNGDNLCILTFLPAARMFARNTSTGNDPHTILSGHLLFLSNV